MTKNKIYHIHVKMEDEDYGQFCVLDEHDQYLASSMYAEKPRIRFENAEENFDFDDFSKKKTSNCWCFSKTACVVTILFFILFLGNFRYSKN